MIIFFLFVQEINTAICGWYKQVSGHCNKNHNKRINREENEKI
jgi:hypothetical protein